MGWRGLPTAKFVAGVDLGTTEYFVTPNNEIWINGLDGKASVKETVAVFDTVEQALRELWRWRNTDGACAMIVGQLHLDHKRPRLTITEIVAITVKPGSRIIGPVAYQDPSLDMDVQQWAINSGLVQPNA